MTYRLEKRRDRDLLAREATRLLAPAVRRLQGLARDSTPGGARHPRAWSEAMASFVESYELTGHRLPPSWRHLKHSVRAAVGEFAGGVAVSDVDTRLVDYPLPEYSEEWRAAADDCPVSLLRQPHLRNVRPIAVMLMPTSTVEREQRHVALRVQADVSHGPRTVPAGRGSALRERVLRQEPGLVASRNDGDRSQLPLA